MCSDTPFALSSHSNADGVEEGEGLSLCVRVWLCLLCWLGGPVGLLLLAFWQRALPKHNMCVVFKVGSKQACPTWQICHQVVFIA